MNDSLITNDKIRKLTNKTIQDCLLILKKALTDGCKDADVDSIMNEYATAEKPLIDIGMSEYLLNLSFSQFFGVTILFHQLYSITCKMIKENEKKRFKTKLEEFYDCFAQLHDNVISYLFETETDKILQEQADRVTEEKIEGEQKC